MYHDPFPPLSFHAMARLAVQQQEYARLLYEQSWRLIAERDYDVACCLQDEAAHHSRLARTTMYLLTHNPALCSRVDAG